MAREVILRDDIDGSHDDVKTVTLSWGGKNVEIDLSAENRAKVDELLAPYLRAGRRPRTSAAPAPSLSKAERRRRSAVRTWAAEHGIEVSPRGPIPQHVIDQYDAAELRSLGEENSRA